MDPHAPDLDPDSRKKVHRDPALVAPRAVPGLPVHGGPPASTLQDFEDREKRREHAQRIQSMSAYERHQHFISIHKSVYGGSIAQLPEPKSDLDILREEYRFIRTAEDDAGADASWEKQLAQKYYNQLFREFCLGDFSRYKEGKVGLRWRSKEEVISGKGQFTCGNIRCSVKEGLKSFEVNFGYVEAGQKKNALVKITTCASCTKKLHYKQLKEAKLKAREERRKEKQLRREKRRLRAESESSEQKTKKKQKQKHPKKRSRNSSSSSDSESSSSDSDASSSSSAASSGGDDRRHKRRSKRAKTKEFD